MLQEIIPPQRQKCMCDGVEFLYVYKYYRLLIKYYAKQTIGLQ